MPTVKPYPGTQSILRAVAVLKQFDDTKPAWGLSELARAVGINKTTTFRLLSALESEGLVARAEDGEQYILGPEIISLAGHALRSNNMRAISRPTLEDLAAQTGETSSLEILTGREMLIIDEVVGEHLVGGLRQLGTRWPAHGTSTGLAILATWAADKQEAFLSHSLVAVTPATIVDAGELRQLLTRFAHQGYAVSDEMLEPGLIAIGAPVKDLQGQATAAISIYGPKSRLTPNRIPSLGQMIRDAACAISLRLGHREPQL